jgi:hypothetical protein
MRFIFQNKSGETCPAYGCGRLKSILSTDEATGNPVFELVKPDGEDGIYVVNGPNNIVNDALGACVAISLTSLVLVDDGSVDDAPEFGEVCGPVDARWAATVGGTGLRATGNVANRLMPVMAISSGGGAGTPSILFEIVRVLRGFGLNCNAMECEVINITCGGGGVSIGDIVTVYDEIGCIFNAPEHLLAGLRGYAIQMGNPSYASDDPLVFEPGTEDIAKPTGSCRWCAQSTCCVEEE